MTNDVRRFYSKQAWIFVGIYENQQNKRKNVVFWQKNDEIGVDKYDRQPMFESISRRLRSKIILFGIGVTILKNKKLLIYEESFPWKGISTEDLLDRTIEFIYSLHHTYAVISIFVTKELVIKQMRIDKWLNVKIAPKILRRRSYVNIG